MKNKKPETQFLKRMPPGGKVLRRRIGKITATDLEDGRWRLWLHQRGEEGDPADLPKKLFIKHGIKKMGQLVEYIFVRTIKTELKIVLRPLKMKKISKRTAERMWKKTRARFKNLTY